MGEIKSLQEKINLWLSQHPQYSNYTEEEILSILSSDLNYNFTTEELEELSLFLKNDSAYSNIELGLTLDKHAQYNQNIEQEKTQLVKEKLKERLSSISQKTDEAEKSNGWIGSAWSWIKNTTGWGDSSDKIRDQLKLETEILEVKNTSIAFETITGEKYTAENIEKFLNNELQTKSEEAYNSYIEGQEMASDLTGDLVSGIAAVGIYTLSVLAAPVSGGASIALGAALATATGGGIKCLVKASDTINTDKKYDSAGKDFLTGAFSGLLAPITAGLGGAAGKCVAKSVGVNAIKSFGKDTTRAFTEKGVKDILKNALINPAGYEYSGKNLFLRGLAKGTEMGVDGALSGSIDSAFRAEVEGEDVSSAFLSGLAGGAILSPAIGGGFKLAGKGGSKLANLFNKDLPDIPTPIEPNDFSLGLKKYEFSDEAKNIKPITPKKLKEEDILLNKAEFEQAEQRFIYLDDNSKELFKQIFKCCIGSDGKVNTESLELAEKLLLNTNAYCTNNITQTFFVDGAINKDIAEALIKYTSLRNVPSSTYTLQKLIRAISDNNNKIDFDRLNKIIELQSKNISINYDTLSLGELCKRSDGSWNDETYNIIKMLDYENNYSGEDIKSIVETCLDNSGNFNNKTYNHLHTLFNENKKDIRGYAMLLKTCKDSSGNISPEKYNLVKELCDNEYLDIVSIIVNLPNIKFEDLALIKEIKDMAPQYKNLKNTTFRLLSFANSDNKINHDILEKIVNMVKINEDSISEIDNYLIQACRNVKNPIMICEQENILDLNAIDVFPKIKELSDKYNIPPSEILRLCQNNNRQFQPSNLEYFELFPNIQATYYKDLLYACKNNDGLISRRKVEKLIELLTKYDSEKTALLLNISSDINGNFKKEFFNKAEKIPFDVLRNIQRIRDYIALNDDDLNYVFDVVLKNKKHIQQYTQIHDSVNLFFDDNKNFSRRIFSGYIDLLNEVLDLEKANKLKKGYESTIIQTIYSPVSDSFETETKNIMFDLFSKYTKNNSPYNISELVKSCKNKTTGLIDKDKLNFAQKLLDNDLDPISARDILARVVDYKSDKFIKPYYDMVNELLNINACGFLPEIVEYIRTTTPNFAFLTTDDANYRKILGVIKNIKENGYSDIPLALRMCNDKDWNFNQDLLNKLVKLEEAGCPSNVQRNICITNQFKEEYLDLMERVKEKMFEKRNLLKAGVVDLSDEDLYHFIYQEHFYDIQKFIYNFDEATFEAGFANKLGGLEDLLIDSKNLFMKSANLSNELHKVFNPAKYYKATIEKLTNEIKELKQQFPIAKVQGNEALDALKREINTKTGELRKIQEIISITKFEPNDLISKIKALSGLKENDCLDLLKVIKPNLPTEKALKEAKANPDILKAFENRAVSNQDFKTWYSLNILKPQNDKLWNEAINRKIFEKLNLEYDEELSKRLKLDESPFLPNVLSSNEGFKLNFKSLVELIKSNPNKSIVDILNELPQNIYTRKRFKSMGIDYDRWVNADKNSYKTIKIELDAETARNAAIKNLEADLMDDAFKNIPKEETDKLINTLNNLGYNLKSVSEINYDAEGYQHGNINMMRLYKGDTPIEFDDLAQIISALKKEINSNDFWTKTHKDTRINDAKNTIYNHIMKLRDTEIQNAKNLKKNTISTLEVHQTDMNDISHALFLGNHGHCCTAVGTGCNQFSAPTYIKNKCITAIEVMDGNEFVGNTMCYIAKVDGRTALILDNIEMSAKYQDNDEIRDAFMEYARQFCKEIGRPDIPIYAGPYRHKFNMNKYKQRSHLIQIQGSTGDDNIYIDYKTSAYKVNNKRMDTVKLFRIS